MKKPVGPSVDGLFRYRLEVAYDGTDFAGWAKQPRLRTVQGELLRGLEKIFGKDKDDFGMRVAGRTDKGVHAAAQVVHVDLSEKQLKRIGRGHPVAERLNRIIDGDVRVISFELAPAGFDARFSALFRRYRYSIADKQVAPNPMLSRYALSVPWALDVAPMNEAAKEFYGLKDFKAYCKEREGTTTIRVLREIVIRRRKSDGVIEIEIEADAFCHNMVRSIVGALIAVGKGQATSADVRATLERASRTQSYRVVAAQGLTLIEIGYPADELLAQQAELAKNLRSHEELED